MGGQCYPAARLGVSLSEIENCPPNTVHELQVVFFAVCRSGTFTSHPLMQCPEFILIKLDLHQAPLCEMADELGLEPRQRDSKSPVLPLHHSSVWGR